MTVDKPVGGVPIIDHAHDFNVQFAWKTLVVKKCLVRHDVSYYASLALLQLYRIAMLIHCANEPLNWTIFGAYPLKFLFFNLLFYFLYKFLLK